MKRARAAHELHLQLGAMDGGEVADGVQLVPKHHFGVRSRRRARDSVAHAAQRAQDALRVGRAIEELDYYWYEDPLVEEDIYNYIKLHQKLDIPIMSTEYAPGRYYGMTQWITEYATDVLRGDVAVTGGITPMIRLCNLAEGFNMKCEIHHGGNSLNNVANLHITMAVPNCEFFEFFPCTGANMYGLVEDIQFDDGVVHAPTEPGLGYAIDWERLRKGHTATLE